eukprot:COSAG06_NODE_56807_length_283_cov_0.597826_1_plen_86_part_10
MSHDGGLVDQKIVEVGQMRLSLHRSISIEGDDDDDGAQLKLSEESLDEMETQLGKIKDLQQRRADVEAQKTDQLAGGNRVVASFDK